MNVKQGKEIFIKFYFLLLKSDFVILKNMIEIEPNIDESPASFAERLSLLASSKTKQHHKQKYGQYFTSEAVAKLMASFYTAPVSTNTIRILDPGAGTAVLSCALTEALLSGNKQVTIELDCYEADPSLIPYTKRSLEYLKLKVSAVGAILTYNLFDEDFLSANKYLFVSGEEAEKQYDVIISNPPFFKIKPHDDRFDFAKNVFYGQTNIYSLFLYASARLLKQEGELIFLIPRSFCSGSFFADFRKQLFNTIMFERVHLLSSGSEIFDDCGTLEASVILKAKKANTDEDYYNIIISRTEGAETAVERKYVFRFSKTENIIPLPSSNDDEKLLYEMNRKTTSLKQCGYSVSGGNALKEDIKKYDIHRVDNYVDKALVIKKDALPKSEFIVADKATEHLLIPNSNYIFLRRYNKREKEKKISAFAYINKSPEIKYLCVDKQLLYLYSTNNPIRETETLQITDYLNSNKLNNYLYIVYGNINLRPEEIEEIPFL